MRFALIDRVVELEPRQRIVAIKAVSLSEEYLAEHFPTFPVLPGVFMLEAMVEAATWLVRVAEDFAHAVILLESAKGVTYKSFVPPGRVLRVEVKCLRLAPLASRFAGVGSCDGIEVVKGRFNLTHSNLADRAPALEATDHRIRRQLEKRWSIIEPAEASPAESPVSG